MKKLIILCSLQIQSLLFGQISYDNGTQWIGVDDAGKGGVTYTYKISKYETTVNQYASFLNSVATTIDSYGLFHGFNWRYAEPITRSGSPGAYSYNVVDGFGSRAMTGMLWLDAARYINWLNNGANTSSSTENGVYELNGIRILPIGTAIARNASAQVFIPNQAEWLKAGFYDHSKDGSGGWWNLANKANVGYNEFGGVIPGDVSKMNINQAYFDSTRGYVTDVGYFSGEASYYGTFDQSGNVWEWIEEAPAIGTAGGLRGGGWDYNDATSGSAMVGGNQSADFAKDSTGFRIAMVPEPSALSLLAFGLGGLAILRLRRS
jgi:formylglycine-generating enzyme required for sulfatase activity